MFGGLAAGQSEGGDPEDEGKTGRRTDGRNLTEEWTKKGNNHLFIFDQAGFDAIDIATSPKVLGLFEMSHMEYEADREKDAAKEPSLADMTAKAIELLKADGQSCLPTDPTACQPAPEVRFAWGLAAGTAYDDCAPQTGDAGFAVPSGGTAQVKPTIHGDHWFFTNITQGAEITERRAALVDRRRQAIALAR